MSMAPFLGLFGACVLLANPVTEAVRVAPAPWMPVGNPAAVAAPQQLLATPGAARDAAARAPAVVSEGFRRLFTELSRRHSAKNSPSAISDFTTSPPPSLPTDSRCLTDFETLLSIPGHNVFNASKGVEAIDAFGKPGSDLLFGNVQLLGAFDECLNIGGDYVEYWAVPLNLSYVFSPIPPLVQLNLGMCVPNSCDKENLNYFVNETNKYLKMVEPLLMLSADYDKVITTTSRTVPLSNGAIVMIVVCAIFLFLALVGSAVDIGTKILSCLLEKMSVDNGVYEPRSERAPLLGKHCRSDGPTVKRRQNDLISRFEIPLEFITAFSVFKNVEMILSTKQPPTAITSLNGIRVISMCWVILAHTFLWCLSTISNPLYVIFDVAPRFSAQPIVNGFFSVDSFFFLSGVLVAYLTLREMQRKKGRFPVLTYYLHRYLRLTMVYAFLLFFWWFLTVQLGSGPLWESSFGVGSGNYKACEKYWWTNLLYINNFYPWKLNDECMGWTWYLANDMQFFLLAPLVLIPLYHIFPIGLIIGGFLLAVTLAVNGAIAGTQEFLANTVLPESSNARESDDIYVKPYCRAAPYIVGILLGFLLFKKVRININWAVNGLIYAVMWVVAAGCCFSTVYGLYDSFHGHELSLAENVSYIMFSRFVWAVGLGLIVFACHNGYGWVVNDFLSMKIWIPLSRLTYTAYLVHPIVLSVMINTTRGSVAYMDYLIAIYAVAMVVISFAAAGVVAIFVEFPLSNLEMAVFKVAGLKPRESVRRVSSSQDRLSPALEQPDTPIKT